MGFFISSRASNYRELAKLQCAGGGLVAKSCPAVATPWTVAQETLLTTEFSRQEYWSRWPFPSPRDLPNPGIKLSSPALQVDSLPTEPLGKLQ